MKHYTNVVFKRLDIKRQQDLLGEIMKRRIFISLDYVA